MRILITGSEGFLGSEIIKILNKKRKIKLHGLSRKLKSESNYNIINLDLLKKNSIKRLFKKYKYDILIHCAWYTNPKDYLSSKKNLIWLKISKTLINEFYNSGGKQFIGIGSNAEFKVISKINKISEKKYSSGAKTLYGKCKSELNHYLLKKYKNSKWIRIFWLFGKKEKKGRYIQEMISSLKKNKSFKLNFPNIRRDYISTEQAARLIVRIVLEEKVNGAFNVCSGKSIQLKKISEMALKELKSGRIIYGENKETNTVYGEVKKISNITGFKTYSVESDLTKYIKNFY